MIGKALAVRHRPCFRQQNRPVEKQQPGLVSLGPLAPGLERRTAVNAFGNALVVFSGCQTIVDPWANPSGAGLLGARAGAIVGTWREVDDRASVVLMREFYRVLAGDPSASPARALNEARRATRDWQDGRGRRPFAHPAYWAAFGLVAGFDD